MYGSEFIQQLKLSMEDSNSPQTKGKGTRRFCASFCVFSGYMFRWKLWAPAGELLPELGMEMVQCWLQESGCR